MKYQTVKRSLDFIFALFAICLVSPILLVVVLLQFSSTGPIFFRQTRVGRKRNSFELLKFRTMTVNEDRNVEKVLDPADPEITKIGKYLRRFKIDELPQLINVLRGDMSLVGPRPPLPSLLNEMTEKEKKRFEVLPGLTGLAQVNGNIHLTWQERFRYDCYYVDKSSFMLDVKIILKTILIVIFGEEKFLNKGFKE